MTVLDQVPYAGLTPDLILAAVETTGLCTSGSLLALNSYENRVYQVGIEDGTPVVVKFYRPGRWSDAAIQEEHDFIHDLARHEIPVVTPFVDAAEETLHHYAGHRFALFPRRGGRWPDLDNFDNLLRLGRTLGRIHAVGAVRPFIHRPALTVAHFGTESLAFLLAHSFLPAHLELRYRQGAEQVLEGVAAAYLRVGEYQAIRLHGDCHPGNILWADGPHLVDFDDCRMGPAIQDLWMFLSGNRLERTNALAELLAGYEEFYPFTPRELHLVEALRSLRMIHYSAWIARRWNDPAFPANFPWFGTDAYWEQQTLALEEQLRLLDEAPLPVYGWT
ncbi:Stress response kinase A [Gammaproteobacteria bacterium]